MVVHAVLKHVIVDGSNIATEGRETPSLAQLDEAVQAFIREYEPEIVTVVVDATFPNRIAKAERKVFEDAIAAGEVITPPAGAIGRGDAFVLQIADRAGATVLSNDSFQEFHGTYDWLFDGGRLIGGKPVPHVGWVFMPRTPVRGPASRRSISAAKRAEASEVAAAEPAPSARRAPEPARPAAAPPQPAPSPAAPTVASPAASVTYNEALPFIEFVSDHPVGSAVDAVVEHFGSHGAYLRIGDVRAYVPLKNLAHPAPRSAKDVVRVGESRRFVVAAIDPPRRGIDLAIPGVVDLPPPPRPTAPARQEPSPRRATKATRAAKAPRKQAKAATKASAAERAGTAAKRPAKQAAAKAPRKQARAATKASAADKVGTAAKRPAKKAAKQATAKPRKAAAKKASTAKKAAPTARSSRKQPGEGS